MNKRHHGGNVQRAIDLVGRFNPFLDRGRKKFADRSLFSTLISCSAQVAKFAHCGSRNQDTSARFVFKHMLACQAEGTRVVSEILLIDNNCLVKF